MTKEPHIIEVLADRINRLEVEIAWLKCEKSIRFELLREKYVELHKNNNSINLAMRRCRT